jgi:hypothetical protein
MKNILKSPNILAFQELNYIMPIVLASCLSGCNFICSIVLDITSVRGNLKNTNIFEGKHPN